MYLTSSQGSAAFLSDSSGPDFARSSSANSIPIAEPSSASTGLPCPVSTMSATFELEMSPASISSLAALPVSAPASPQRSRGKGRVKPSGRKWRGLPAKAGLNGSSSSSHPAIPGGKLKLRAIWRALAITHPDLNDRLAIVARLIAGGACSLLPTPCASDATRWPGSPDHARLHKNTRGLRLQEELGVRPGPEILEWMMGLPIGYTALPLSVTPCFPPMLKPSEEPS